MIGLQSALIFYKGSAPVSSQTTSVSVLKFCLTTCCYLELLFIPMHEDCSIWGQRGDKLASDPSLIITITTIFETTIIDTLTFL